jgi:ferrous iron transport protein A
MNNPIFLVNLKEGEKAVIISIIGGVGVTQRLTDMGLTPSTEITVIKSAFFGPIEISVRGSKLAIGRGIAAKILVERK